MGQPTDENGGAGILIVSSHSDELAHALRFTFTITNNEVEYEALIVGHILVQQLDTRQVQTYLDSQVVVEQVYNIYRPKDKRIRKYITKVQYFILTLEYFRVACILRSENCKADTISKVVSSWSLNLSQGSRLSMTPLLAPQSSCSLARKKMVKHG